MEEGREQVEYRKGAYLYSIPTQRPIRLRRKSESAAVATRELSTILSTHIYIYNMTNIRDKP
jgi:hypothetical protein